MVCQCGNTMRVVDPAWGPERYRAQCRATDPNAIAPRTAPPREPGIVRKVGSMCMAIAKWKLAGSPVRTPDRVAGLLAICQTCEFLLDAGTSNQRCGKCGCPVNDKLTNRNKLYLATESCPLEEPRWTADV